MIGREWGDYIIEDLLGRGGMGKVYLAYQKSLGRRVALKVMTLEGDNSRRLMDRFVLEARLAASIEHPNVVTIYHVGEQEDALFIAMELVEGVSLEAMVKNGPVDELLVWRIAFQVGQGLMAASRQEIIHRDIKPANILVTPQKTAKITDFGISKKLDDDPGLTRVGMIIGTPYYLSPEQAVAGEADFRSDIYSLGASLYHALTGELVFTGDIPMDFIVKHKSEPVVPPGDHMPSLRIESSAILGKMLQKNPDDRYLCYGDLLTDIAALIDNRPLVFANDETAFSVYTHPPAGLEKAATGDGGAGDGAPGPPLLEVGGSSAGDLQAALLRGNALDTHLIYSLPELKVYLKNRPARVVLDSVLLGARTFDFCRVLKQDFPETPTGILVDEYPPAAESGGAARRLFLRRREWEKQLADPLDPDEPPVPAKAAELCLKPLLSLGLSAGWSVAIEVTPEAGEKGELVLGQGRIKSARQGGVKGKQALRSLLKAASGWRLAPADRTAARGVPGNGAAGEHSRSDSPAWSGAGNSMGLSGLGLGSSAPGPVAGQAADMNVSGSQDLTDISPMDAQFLKALIVDEDAGGGEALAEFLNNTGNIMALSLQNPDEAFAILDIEPFNVLVSRAGQMGTGDIPFQKEIQQIHPGVKQIIITSGEREDTLLQTMAIDIPAVREDQVFSIMPRTILNLCSENNQDAS